MGSDESAIGVVVVVVVVVASNVAVVAGTVAVETAAEAVVIAVIVVVVGGGEYCKIRLYISDFRAPYYAKKNKYHICPYWGLSSNTTANLIFSAHFNSTRKCTHPFYDQGPPVSLDVEVGVSLQPQPQVLQHWRLLGGQLRAKAQVSVNTARLYPVWP